MTRFLNWKYETVKNLMILKTEKKFIIVVDKLKIYGKIDVGYSLF